MYSAMTTRDAWSARPRATLLALSLLAAALGVSPGQAAACGMHGFGFSPFSFMGSDDKLEATPGARLSVTGMLVPRADTPSKVTVLVSTPQDFEQPQIAIDSPEAIVFDSGTVIPLAQDQKNISLSYTATTGNHWVTFTLTGSLNGEDISVKRRVYFAVRDAAIAARY